jgi:hypothetical protein
MLYYQVSFDWFNNKIVIDNMSRNLFYIGVMIWLMAKKSTEEKKINASI